MQQEKAEVRVYAVGTHKGASVLFAMVNGSAWVLPTDLRTMAQLAELGVPIKNEY